MLSILQHQVLQAVSKQVWKTQIGRFVTSPLLQLQAAVAASYGNASYCGNGLNASLAVCSVAIGTGNGPVNVTLPTPISVTLTASPSFIAP